MATDMFRSAGRPMQVRVSGPNRRVASAHEYFNWRPIGSDCCNRRLRWWMSADGYIIYSIYSIRWVTGANPYVCLRCVARCDTQ